MKRLTILLTALLLVLFLTACGSKTTQPASSSSPHLPDNSVVLTATANDGVELEESHLQAALDYVETLLKASGRSDYTAGVNYHDSQIILKFESAVSDEEATALTVLPTLTFCDPSGETVMDGSSVKRATAGYDQATSAYVVNIEFTKEGAVRFAEVTEANIGQTLAIYLDDTMLSDSVIQAPIYDGAAQISGDFDAESVTDLANKINAASLPLTLERTH